MKYDTCPLCGKPKRSVAATCKYCQRQSQNRVDFQITQDREWLTEFAGLFWGEGSAMIIRNNTSYSPALVLRLRDDDHLVIEDIQRHLGGRILHSYRNKTNPKHGNQIEWRTTNLEHCEIICRLLLDNSTLLAKKKNDVEAVLDFCRWRKTTGRYLTDEDREEAEFRMNALRESRMYSL